ncbi:MAG: arginine--tRNA ligase [candidate division Zixibacteria bacterium]|nr:arginine--tRNA ligase [candidate division Zixibacteria bacterium]
MNKFVEEIVKILKDKISLSSEKIEALIEVPPEEKFGDYAFPCHILSKELKKPPQEIASKLSSELKPKELIEQIYPIGPYINFKVNREKFAEYVLQDIYEKNLDYGLDTQGKRKTIVMDYSHPNIAKPFGIGHLRSTVIGNALYNIFRKLGYEAIRINHLGDWGTQFGKVIAAYKMWGEEKELSSDPIATLYDLYVRFHREVEGRPELEEEARRWFKKLEDGDSEALGLWEKFKNYSLEEFNRIYKMLDISFDSYAGESFYNQFIEKTIDKMNKMGLTEISQDALIVNLEKYGMPPCLIRKKDEASLYATRDICAAIYRYETYHFHKALYIVGSAQKLYFQQLFKVLELMCYPWANNLVHVDFGWVKFKQVMMSTRKGNIVLLEDVLNKSIDLALKIIKEKNPDLENKEKVAFDVGIGAVIFANLFTRRNKDIDFDWDKVLNFEGETGPYVQYTHARLCSLIRKYGQPVENQVYFKSLSTEEEHRLIKRLEDFPRRIKSSAREYDPALICSYLIELASLFNRFYQKERIITENVESTKARMLLVKAVQTIIKSGLSILGIKSPEKM